MVARLAQACALSAHKQKQRQGNTSATVTRLQSRRTDGKYASEDEDSYLNSAHWSRKSMT